MRALEICFPVDLGQAEHGLGHQVGPRMGEAVPALVVRGILQPEVGAQVHHPASALHQLGHHGMGLGVRIAHEGHIGLTGGLGGVGDVAALDPKVRKDSVDASSPHTIWR